MFVASDYRAAVGEAPVWDERSQRLLWVDIWGRCMIESAAGKSDVITTAPEMVAAVLPCETDDVVILALESHLVAFAQADGSMTRIDPPAGHAETHRFNDAAVDAAGRLLIGTMRKSAFGPAPTGVLYSLGEDGWRTLLEGFWTLNGLAFSPDGRTLYLSDSHPDVQTVWRCPYDPDTGVIGERQVFARFQELPGRPDGATVDRAGNYWIAAVGGWSIHGFSPDGELIRTIDLPVENPTKLSLGGPELATIYVTSMSEHLSKPDETGLAGRLLALDGEIAGLPARRFAGLSRSAGMA